MNFIHPEYFKDTARYRKIEKAPLPKKVILPLSQHTGAPSECVVKVGDEVLTGSVIAQAKGFISSTLHSSVSGKVISIDNVVHPVIGMYKGITIESDGEDRKAFLDSLLDVSNLSKEEIITFIKEAGIVGLGGAAFPTHVKMSPPSGKKIDVLIVNGAECEPFLTCDHRLMLEKSKEIILGIYLASKMLGIKNVIIAAEDNKLDAIESLGSAFFRDENKECSIKIETLKTRYPQGGEKQLIKTLLNREVPSGGLPLDIGCCVNNVQTIFSIYEAVYFRKPLYERVITINGQFLRKPRNILVRIGTPVKDLLEYCGLNIELSRRVEDKRNIYKIVMGGPMTGVCQYTQDAPIIKGTSGILLLDEEFKIDEEMDCIRCSRCISSCPVGLMPCMIGLAMKNNRFSIAAEYKPLDCIECGVCSYVCPSSIPLVQYIKLAKARTKR